MGREVGFLSFSLIVVVALSFDMVGVHVVEAANGLLPPADPPLRRQYYEKLNTCANVEAFVQFQVKQFWKEDKSITAKFLKLLYTDCMITGCDASILLDGPTSEKTAPQNFGLGTGIFLIIDKIKKVLEARCPGVVSCADILNLATRDALHLAGAPSYIVLLGRRDGIESHATSVDLPPPSISWEAALSYFKSRQLDVQDMTTLLGGHTMGKTHCNYILDRLYNFNNTGKPDPSMEKTILLNLRKQCTSKKSNPLVYLNPDNGPNYKFTNTYYSRVLANKAVLGVDQQLRFGNGNDTNELLDEYSNKAKGFQNFRKGFALSITRMGSIKVLTGKRGEIRLNCRVRN